MIDPYNNLKMTYSDIVHLLSSHMINTSSYEEDSSSEGSYSNGDPAILGQQISVLEKFVNQKSGGAYFGNGYSGGANGINEPDGIHPG
jgi:hypothetical protein